MQVRYLTIQSLPAVSLGTNEYLYILPKNPLSQKHFFETMGTLWRHLKYCPEIICSPCTTPHSSLINGLALKNS